MIPDMPETEFDATDPYARAKQTFPALSDESARVASYGAEEIIAKGAIIFKRGGNSAGQAAMFLSRTTSRVHVVIRAAALAATMSDYLIQRILHSPRITLHADTEITGLGGDDRLRSVTCTNHRTGTSMTRQIGNVFVMILGPRTAAAAKASFRWATSARARSNKSPQAWAKARWSWRPCISISIRQKVRAPNPAMCGTVQKKRGAIRHSRILNRAARPKGSPCCGSPCVCVTKRWRACCSVACRSSAEPAQACTSTCGARRP